MADKTTYRSDGSVATTYIGATKSEGDVAAAEATSRLGSTAGAGLGTKGKAFTPPKMNPGESSGAYSERVRKARMEHDEPPKATALRNVRKP
jgi:hypothetical protein